MLHVKARLWAVARALGAKSLLDRRFGTEPVVLMYHRFSLQPAARRVALQEFEAQLRYLARHSHVISLTELARGLKEGARWPRSTVVVTVDDGHYDVYDIAFPLLQRYRVPATVFVTTAFIDGDMWYWPDKLRYLIFHPRAKPPRVHIGGDERVLQIGSEVQREAAWNLLADHAFMLPPPACAAFVEEVSRQVEVPLPAKAPDEFRACTWDQIREMSAGGIEIGAHGVAHERLTAIEESAVRFEVTESKRAIEAQIHQGVRSFAYPFGGLADQDAIVRGIVRDAGFDVGCVAFFDAHLYSDRYGLRRFGVGPGYWEFIKAADGIERAGSRRAASKRLAQ